MAKDMRILPTGGSSTSPPKTVPNPTVPTTVSNEMSAPVIEKEKEPEIKKEVVTPVQQNVVAPPSDSSNTQQLILEELMTLRKKIAQLEADKDNKDKVISYPKEGEVLPVGAVEKEFIVSLKDCATRKVKVVVMPGMDIIVHKMAIDKFNKIMGVRSSVHQHEVKEVLPEEECVGLPS